MKILQKLKDSKWIETVIFVGVYVVFSLAIYFGGTYLKDQIRLEIASMESNRPVDTEGRFRSVYNQYLDEYTLRIEVDVETGIEYIVCEAPRGVTARMQLKDIDNSSKIHSNSLENLQIIDFSRFDISEYDTYDIVKDMDTGLEYRVDVARAFETEKSMISITELS